MFFVLHLIKCETCVRSQEGFIVCGKMSMYWSNFNKHNVKRFQFWVFIVVVLRETVNEYLRTWCTVSVTCLWGTGVLGPIVSNAPTIGLTSPPVWVYCGLIDKRLVAMIIAQLHYHCIIRTSGWLWSFLVYQFQFAHSNSHHTNCDNDQIIWF